MALFEKINTKLIPIANTGFGSNASNTNIRFMNKNGKSRVLRMGLSYFERQSWYHVLLDLPTWKFLGLIFIFYVGINFVFAGLYFVIGVENLNGIHTTSNPWDQIGQAYFFSAQTFTTVGYGHISPMGFVTSALAALEALFGLMSLAIVTGLFFGRFSNPRLYLKFSHNAIIAPYKNGTALMFRMAPFKNTNYLNAKVQANLGLQVEENGVLTTKFYNLDLEINTINTLVLSWTVVHPINKDSPFYQFSLDDFKNRHGEILVFVTVFDEMYSTTVAKRTSYLFSEIVYGAKFKSMFESSKKHAQTVLYLNQINDHELVEL